METRRQSIRSAALAASTLLLSQFAPGSTFTLHQPIATSHKVISPQRLHASTATTDAALGADASSSLAPSLEPITPIRDVIYDPGPAEPFELVRGDLKNLKTHIKELVERHVGSKDSTREGGTNPLLQEAAREFFERRERAWRPGTVLLMSRALAAPASLPAKSDKTNRKGGSNTEPSTKQRELAEIVEMMVTAQVIHDDVLEDLEEVEQLQERGDDDEGQGGGEGSKVAAEGVVRARGNVAHRMYSSALGNKVSLLAGDFLLARASVQLARLTNTEVVGIIGTSLENMCRGEIMHAQASVQDKLSLDYFRKKVGLKSASLLADACRCSAILQGVKSDSPRAEAAWQFGHHMVMAYSLTAELDVFNRLLNPNHWPASASLDDEGSGKLRARLDACVGLAPFAFAAEEAPRLGEMAERGFSAVEDGEVQEALSLLSSGEGARLAHAQAMEHCDLAKAAVQATPEEGGLPDSLYRDGLLVLCDYVVQDEQRGLQRAKWQEMQAKRTKKEAARGKRAKPKN